MKASCRISLAATLPGHSPAWHSSVPVLFLLLPPTAPRSTAVLSHSYMNPGPRVGFCRRRLQQVAKKKKPNSSPLPVSIPLSHPLAASVHSDTGLGHVTCFGPRNISNQDASRGLTVFCTIKLADSRASAIAMTRPGWWAGG